MGSVLFQYGTAVHLAILTVAPLFLHRLCGPQAQAAVLFWLGLLGLMWAVMNPSPRQGEWPRDARHRIGWEILRDPFLTFSVIAVILSAIRAFNCGVDIDYNSSLRLWYLKEPAVPLLPGSVSGLGQLPLAGLWGLAVVILGVRHALGVRACLFYLVLCGLLSAAAVGWWLLRPTGGASAVHAATDPTCPFYEGSLLGVYFLFALVSWFGSWTAGRVVSEVLSALSAAVSFLGLMLFAPTHAFCLFALFGLLAIGGGIVAIALRGSFRAWPRLVLATAIIFTPLILCAVGVIPWPVVWPIFPEGFARIREAATSVALEAWKSSVQLGVGLGAYPLAQGFFATDEHWKVLTEAQTAVPNGWIQFLFERGLLGGVTFLVGFGLMIWDCVRWFVRSGMGFSSGALVFFGPVVALAVIALSFVECTYVQVEMLMPVGAALALTTAGFQKSSEERHG